MELNLYLFVIIACQVCDSFTSRDQSSRGQSADISMRSWTRWSPPPGGGIILSSEAARTRPPAPGGISHSSEARDPRLFRSNENINYVNSKYFYCSEFSFLDNVKIYCNGTCKDGDNCGLLATNETKKLTFLSELLLKPVATFAQIP